MVFFTPHERSAIIFLAAAFFCGICLNIIFKLSPASYQRLNVLDAPLFSARIDINQATYEQLLTVPGFGPGTAARIIEARRGKGRFGSLEDLRKIKRLSRRMFDRAAPHLTVVPAVVSPGGKP